MKAQGKISIAILIGALLLPFLSAQEKKWDAVNHDKTNFPLTGKHRTVACSECHINGLLQGTPTSCEACHWYRKQDDRYNLSFGIHCGDCHTTFDWKKLQDGVWDHELNTGFSLVGIHKTLDCFQCHKGKAFVGTGGDCIDCHLEDYQKTDEPNHVVAQFPTDCQICHNMLDWENTQFGHSSFRLKGAHKTTDCSSCHTNQYAGTPDDCVACHLADYNGTTNPNHRQVNYSTNCEACHGDEAITWLGAVFDHEIIWPIRGAHLKLDCDDCHKQGTAISGECVSCHLSDYNNTRDPNHRQAGFDTDCEICHLRDAQSWSQVNFNHIFPIESGDHRSLACSDCHLTANYIEFSCLDCHAHTKSEMDEEHQGVGGYNYNSQACYSCHPTGTE